MLQKIMKRRPAGKASDFIPQLPVVLTTGHEADLDFAKEFAHNKR